MLNIFEKLGFGEEWANKMIGEIFLKSEGLKSIVVSKKENEEISFTQLPFDALEKLKDFQAEIMRLKIENEKLKSSKND